LPNEKGLLINFEGIDKCGKTTQVNLLQEKLIELKVPTVLYREPGSTNISEQVRRILLSREHKSMDYFCEALLYSAARAQLVAEKIIPALAEGKAVLLDRYYHSSLAYQGYGRGVPLDLIWKMTEALVRDCQPDLTIVLDISPEEASKRRDLAGRDRLEMSSIKFFQAVRQGYLELAKNDEKIKVIEGILPVEEIGARIWEEVRRIKDKG